MKKRQINNLANGYMKIQLVIDEKQKKLSDKYENLKLSHNRKYNLLKQIENNLKVLKEEEKLSNFGLTAIEFTLLKIHEELNSVGRMKGF